MQESMVEMVWACKKKGSGRPKRRWMDCVREDMRGIGAEEEDAQDRDRWRRLVSATPHESGNS
jgi:hypothetical protein